MVKDRKDEVADGDCAPAPDRNLPDGHGVVSVTGVVIVRHAVRTVVGESRNIAARLQVGGGS